MQKIINFLKSLFKRNSKNIEQTNDIKSYTKFVIPISGMSKTQAKESIAELMTSYKEDVEFDSKNGHLTVNGESYVPYNKEIWIPNTVENINNFNDNVDFDSNTGEISISQKPTISK
jgi:hypothetical protein